MTMSAGEVAARVVAGLIDMSERRAERMAELSAAVARAVRELDPAGARNTDPTWWRDMPAWARLDAFDRMRRAHDQLVVLEAQAGEVVLDLRGMLALRPVGDPGRPAGYTPTRAHTELMAMAEKRSEMVSDLAKAVRCLQPHLGPETAADLRAVLRKLDRQEGLADKQRARLSALLLFQAPEARRERSG